MTPEQTLPYIEALAVIYKFLQFELSLFIAHKTKYEYERQVPTEVYLRILDKLIAARKADK